MSAYHIGLTPEHLAGNAGLGRFVFLPGDRSRAKRIAARFQDVSVVENPRGHTAHLGTILDGDRPIDVMSISSGMGPSSVEIVLHELQTLGARRVVRVGSSGRVSSDVPEGSVVVATGAVRDESTSDRWTPREYPAVAHPDAVTAMCEGAMDIGLADHTYAGLVHSKDSLFAREMSVGPQRSENDRYLEVLRAAGVLATEMEASILFVMASVAQKPVPLSIRSTALQTGAILAVYGAVGSEETRVAEQRAIDVAVAGVCAWSRRDLEGRVPAGC